MPNKSGIRFPCKIKRKIDISKFCSKIINWPNNLNFVKCSYNHNFAPLCAFFPQRVENAFRTCTMQILVYYKHINECFTNSNNKMKLYYWLFNLFWCIFHNIKYCWLHRHIRTRCRTEPNRMRCGKWREIEIHTISKCVFSNEFQNYYCWSVVNILPASCK